MLHHQYHYRQAGGQTITSFQKLLQSLASKTSWLIHNDHLNSGSSTSGLFETEIISTVENYRPFQTTLQGYLRLLYIL